MENAAAARYEYSPSFDSRRHELGGRAAGGEAFGYAHASVASLWEIAIKTRLGKLDAGMPLEALAEFFEAIGLVILPIDRNHVITSVEPEPITRDPFDRLLLERGQPSLESFRVSLNLGRL